MSELSDSYKLLILIIFVVVISIITLLTRKDILFSILYSLGILKLNPSFYFHYAIREYIHKGDIVLDIGANWGCYTMLFSRWGAVVYAVEPIKTVSSWIPTIKNAKLFSYALGDKEQTVALSNWRDTSGAYKISSYGQYKAQMVKGSRIFKDLCNIDFIKIDVEGSELPILADMKDLISKFKPMILVETNDDKVHKLLETIGYECIDSFFNDFLWRKSK